MASIYRQFKLPHVFPDGEGGHMLKVTTPDGELLEYQLSLEAAARLVSALALVIKDFAARPAKANEIAGVNAIDGNS